MIIEHQDRPKFRCGVMAIVRSSGTVTIGDAITVEFPADPFKVLPAL
jgi:MOSC domain-containing protein YiiM